MSSWFASLATVTCWSRLFTTIAAGVALSAGNLPPATADNLEDGGVRVAMAVTSDALAVVRGGVEQGDFYPTLVVPSLELDLGHLVDWDDTRLFADGLAMFGRDPAVATGALDTPSNVASPVATFRVYQAWLERSFDDDHYNLRAGLYAADSEFDVRPSAQWLMNSGFGTGTDLAQTGLNGPCIYPTSCLGIRVRYAPDGAHYLQFAILDGVAGDPDDPYGTHVELGDGEGVLILAETGLALAIDEDRDVRATLGLWYYSSKFDDVLQPAAPDATRRSRARPGLYTSVEGDLLRESAHGAEGLSGYLRAGTADPTVNQFEYFLSGGFAYVGALPSRGDDVAAFGVLAPINGGDYRKSQRRAGTPADNYELALEVSYSASLLPWVALQLDAQYIINPGTQPGIDDALVLGLRSRIDF